jgi:flagellar basal body-associated protein FliL
LVKLVIVGLWACLMTLASSYAATYWKAVHGKAANAEQAAQNVEYKKTKEFTVPKIADGGIQGYIIVQLSYSLDSAVQRNVTAPPEAFLLDEAFRYIYDDDSIDFNNLKKYDLPKMTKALMENVNARLNCALVKDVLISEFNYMSRSDVKKQL